MNQKSVHGREVRMAGVHKLLPGILVAAFVVRFAAMLALQSWEFPDERSFGYEEGQIAFALVSGQGFSWPSTSWPVGPPGAEIQRDEPVPTTWKAPVNPAIIAASFWLFGPYSAGSAIALELFQSVLIVLGCYLLYRLGEELFNRWTGVMAAAMLAVYPISIHFAVQKVEYGVLLTVLGLLILLQTMGLSRSPGVGRSVILGIVCGLATLVNPVILAFFPFGLLWFLLEERGDWRRRLGCASVVVGLCVATITPWIIRNYVVFDQFVFIRSNFTRELVRANYWEDAMVLEEGRPDVVEGDDGKVSSFFNRHAISLLAAKPGELVRGITDRVPRFWTHFIDDDEEAGTAMLMGAISYYLVLGAALLGIVMSWRRERIGLLILYVLTMPIPFYLTWVGLLRFRFPVEPVLILFASVATTSLLSRWLPESGKAGPVGEFRDAV